VTSADSIWGLVVSICEHDTGHVGFGEGLELLSELKASSDG
jgi:hypothetical protein